MHGSVGASCAVADVRARAGDGLVGNAVGLSNAQLCGDAAGHAARERARNLYARFRLLWAEWRGCGLLRCGGVVAGVGRPVRLQFSRQDEMAWENYGSACVG